jgi:hypothetical protein
MTNYLIAYDGSGSTGGSANYHDETQRIVAVLPADATILFWDNDHRVIGREELDAINMERQGGGGTQSEAIASYILKTNFHGHLIIITDGQVSPSSIDACTKALGPSWSFESVTAHLIETGGQVNMSVTCPFTRVSPHRVYTCVSTPQDGFIRRLTHHVSTEELATIHQLDSINTIEEFMAVASRVESAIVARTMGSTGDPSLRDTILAMKKRMIASKGATVSSTALEEAVTTDDIPRAIRAAVTLTDEYYDDANGGNDVESGSWSSHVNRLVSMCEGALRSTFDLSNLTSDIKGDRARRATTVTPITITDVTATPLTDADFTDDLDPFVCPVTCDDEHDVVLLMAADMPPLLAGLDKDIVNNLTECPLYLLNRPDLVEALKARLDHPISLTALKAAMNTGAPITESPMTRRPVAGGICLGHSTEHRVATTWTLASTIAGGKLMGNPDLWFACVWLLVENGHIPYLEPVKLHLRNQMIWRLQTQKTAISLRGLAEFPSVRVPLGISLWYIFASPVWTLEPRRDLIRAHLSHIGALKQLFDLTGYTLPEDTKLFIKRTRVLMSMLSWIKRDRYALPSAMHALVQKCIRVRPSCYILVDGPASPEQIDAILNDLPPHYHSLPPSELVALAAMVDPSKAAADVALPFYWTIPPLPTATVVWEYGLGDVAHVPVPICSATCRPYYKVHDLTWKEAARIAFGIAVNKLVSMNEQFGNFVIRYGVYPTPSTFIEYLRDRKGQLPSQTEAMVNEVFADYRVLMEQISASEFGKRFDASREVRMRIEIETR